MQEEFESLKAEHQKRQAESTEWRRLKDNVSAPGQRKEADRPQRMEKVVTWAFLCVLLSWLSLAMVQAENEVVGLRTTLSNKDDEIAALVSLYPPKRKGGRGVGVVASSVQGQRQ